MQQLELLSIESPCINVCQSNKRGYCLGCSRSREERFNWLNYSAEEKSKVLVLCKQRSRRRKAQQKKQQTPIPPSQLPTLPTAPQSESQIGNRESEDTPQQTVQDMGLDLFDL